jgi:hypothetical protein
MAEPIGALPCRGCSTAVCQSAFMIASLMANSLTDTARSIG